MDKKITIIGVGKLGLCLALNLEKKGYSIVGIDLYEDYIKSLNDKTYNTSEPFVTEYLKSSKNIKFTTDLKESLKNDIIFVVVRTPSTKDWKYDHTDIEKLAEQLIKWGKQPTRKDLVINCTTFPGYCEELHNRLKKYNYYVSYNPEFIAQGTVIKDQTHCDNVLIGEADNLAGDKIEKIYRDMCESNPIYNRMSNTEAELATNCYLTTKISFANMVGDIANRLNCNGNTVLKAIGTDSRIGSKYIKPGFGFGGPCFPRDNRALAKCGEELGIDAVVSKATDIMNEKHLQYQIEDFIKNNPDKLKEVKIDFVTYKKDSILIEESQQLKFALKLKELGYKIKILDQRQEVLDQLKGII
jgi:nucleotide sugar dehydrogenase